MCAKCQDYYEDLREQIFAILNQKLLHVNAVFCLEKIDSGYKSGL